VVRTTSSKEDPSFLKFFSWVLLLGFFQLRFSSQAQTSGFTTTHTNNGFSDLWKYCYIFTHASFHTVCYCTKWFAAISSHFLSVLPAKMSEFNRHMRQNACYRNLKWTFQDLLPCNCYAIKPNNKTFQSQVSETYLCRQRSRHEWTASSSLHDTRTVHLPLVQWVSYWHIKPSLQE